MWTQVAQVREGCGPWVSNAAASLEAVWQRLDAPLWSDVSISPAAPVLTCYITAVHSSTLTIILLTILSAKLQTQTAHLRGPASPSAPNHGAWCRLYMLPLPPKKKATTQPRSHSEHRRVPVPLPQRIPARHQAIRAQVGFSWPPAPLNLTRWAPRATEWLSPAACMAPVLLRPRASVAPKGTSPSV